MATTDRRVYVRGARLPFEEDEMHEFKGHRNISAEDIPPWTRRATVDFRCSRKAVSRNLNAFLNTGRGGTVYLGVDDVGRVLGMHLTRFQRDHVRLSVRDTLRRYQPPVPDGRCRVTFVPVVHAGDGDGDGDGPHQAFKYDAGQRRKQHRVATHEYCWCDADAKARSQMGHIPAEYVIEVEVRPWDEPAQLHPFHLTEVGSCYIRRQASIQQLTAADVVQLTRHQAAALYERRADQEARLTSRLGAALLRRLDSDRLRLAPPPTADQWCRCGTASRIRPAPPPADWDGDAPSSGGDSGTGTCFSLLDSVGGEMRCAADICPVATGEGCASGGAGAADRAACDGSPTRATPTADTSHAVPAATAIDARAGSRSSQSICAPDEVRAWTSRPSDLRTGSPAAVGTARRGSVVRLTSAESDPVSGLVSSESDGAGRLVAPTGPAAAPTPPADTPAGPAATPPQRVVGPAATCGVVLSGDDLVGPRVDSMWNLAGGRSGSARPAVGACPIHRKADYTEEVGTGVLDSEEVDTGVLDSQEVGERLLVSSEYSSEPESEDSWDASYRPPRLSLS